MARSGNDSERRTVLSLALPAVQDALKAQGFEVVSWPVTDADWSHVISLAPRIDAIVTAGSMPLPTDFMSAATRLGFIACIGAGYEHFDPAALARRGIRLVNSAGVNAGDVADLAFGLFIAARRRIVDMHRNVIEGKWRDGLNLARRIGGNTLGVIGLGAIGRAIATRGEAFGMSIAWSGPRPKSTSWKYVPDPIELARMSDALFVCCPPTPENENLVGEKMLSALGPKGVLVNVGRGSLVDEAALIAALKEGRIAGAGLDVFADEPTDAGKWAGVPNLTLHPHNGGGVLEAIQQSQALVVENLRRHFAGETLINALN